MIRLLADENIPLEAVSRLARSGVDIVSLSIVKPGAQDDEALLIALKDRRTLVTFDTDFGELVFRAKRRCHGIILLRMHPQTASLVVSLLTRVISLDVDVTKSFIVVDMHRVRVISIA